jgi:SAM-dependent methyltransferase
MVEPSRWMQRVRENPGHSQWYIERFRTMAADGADLAGEARTVDAMLPRQARVLDAGCGPGRVGGELARRGHTVVGVDVDPALIEAARQDHPDATWLVGDLALLDLPAQGLSEPFDAVICVGNVLPFLAPSTRRPVLERLRAHLGEDGRAAFAFGAGRGYEFTDFLADADATGWRPELLLATWDLQPFSPDADFLVALMRTGQG